MRTSCANIDKALYLLVQRIEAPVRGGEQAPGSIPDGGPPIRERESELDREIVASAGNRERDILNSGAPFNFDYHSTP
jgi:hypothetical protein